MTFEIALGTRIRKTPFFHATVAAGVARFSVYNHMLMPASYGDPVGEYWRLVEDVSLWDVACERQVEIAGADAQRLTRYLTPRDISRCRVGQGMYVPLCDHGGRLINDPVLLKLAEDRFWLSIADSDVLLWARAVAAEKGFDVSVTEPDVSPLAVQGPKAVEVVADLFGAWVRDLKYFWFRETELEGIPLVVARSGWSKQGGFELYLRDAARGTELWDRVYAAGRAYGIGPGTPNPTERVESGLLSFGGDHDPDANPFEVRMGHLVDLDRDDDFIGRAALARIAREGPRRRQVGLFIEGDPLPANEERWSITRDARPVGMATAITYSLRLERNIALALLDNAVCDDAEVTVETPIGARGASVTGLPFC